MESMEAGFLRGRGNRNDQSIYGENFYFLYFYIFSFSVFECLSECVYKIDGTFLCVDLIYV